MATVVEAVPPLCAGDYLSVEEFLRRWENEPAIKRAELINGVVYMPSPVSIQHGEMESCVGGWLLNYHARTPGTATGHNATTFILDGAPQPDVHLRLLPECGGRSWVEASFLHGSPELLVEVCQTSAAYDLHPKLELYQEAEVQEYVAIVLHDAKVLWHRLIDGAYQVMSPDDKQVFRSRVFPGLWLDGGALLANDAGRVLTTLQNGLDSVEHREFVEKLDKMMQSVKLK